MTRTVTFLELLIVVRPKRCVVSTLGRIFESEATRPGQQEVRERMMYLERPIEYEVCGVNDVDDGIGLMRGESSRVRSTGKEALALEKRVMEKL